MLFIFAKKYLFSSKKTRAINIISWVSIWAIAIGTGALITVLSVFNGIELFVKSLYTTFYTDVKITNIYHKPFYATDSIINYLNAQKGILAIGKTYEDEVLLSADNAQNIITLKGIDTIYARITKLNKAVKYGDTNIFTAEPRLSVGLSIANRMSISEQTISPISIFTFKNDTSGSNSIENGYTEANMYIANVFSVQEEFDNKYCITSLAQMQALMQDSCGITAVELQMTSDKEAEQFVAETKKYLATYNLQAETRYQQNKTLYYVLKSEKWMVFAIMSFMLLIASFNMIGSLSMLVMEKKKDITILKALGNSDINTKNIFLATGVLIGILGAGIGGILAIVICGLQAKYKLVKMAGDNFLLEAYPVKIIGTDVLLVFATVILISVVASWWPSRKAV